jgi:phenylpropionate dioxygenase-like ring-hydroxylating dioxygenase large terminal subunit
VEPKKQVELVRRALAHVAARTTDRDANATTVAVQTYLDERRYEREREVLFRHSPVAVAHVSQLVAPGDFVTHDATGVPLLVVRGNDGALSAFVNVCRHRGNRVEREACGREKKSFVCPYHAWTYGRDGRLQVITHEAGFTSIDRDARGLVRVPVGEAGGLVWVRASPSTSPEDSRLDAASFLGEIADDLGRFGVASSHVYSPHVVDRDLNWKLAIDVFLETYHVRPTHKNSIYPLFFDNLGLVDRVGTHLRTVIPKRTIRGLANEPDEVLGSALRIHANVVFHLFPNTIVLIQPDHASVMTAWPVGIARTRLMTYTLVPEPPDENARSYWDLNNAILHGATEEDLVIGEAIQRGLGAGANEEVVFGAFEHALAHFHAEIAKRVESVGDR